MIKWPKFNLDSFGLTHPLLQPIDGRMTRAKDKEPIADGRTILKRVAMPKNNPAIILLDTLLRAGWTTEELDIAKFNQMIRACEEPMPTYPPSDKTDEFSFELRPSDIHGVGVFTRHFIVEGVRLDLWGDEDTYRKNVLGAYKDLHRAELIDRHSVDGYYPMFLNRMAIGWYLNHSAYPNVESRINDEIYTLRPIAKGTELTIDYATLKEVHSCARL